MTVSWTGAAEQLADDACGIGYAAVAVTASAWRARCEQDAARSLVQAANALTAGVLSGLFDPLPPSPSAEDFLMHAEELESEAAALGKHGHDMAADCEAALDEAIAGHAAAKRRLDRALAADKTDPQVAAAAQAEIDAAQAQMQAMRQVIGDCEAALDLLGQVLERLDYAITCFRRVPDDLAQAYDVPLEYIRDGRVLPWSGDFLTGAAAR
jgi:hypothetical protein